MAGQAIKLKQNQWTNIHAEFSPALAAGTAIQISLGGPTTAATYQNVVSIREETAAPADFNGAHASLNITSPKSSPGAAEFTFMTARSQDEVLVYVQESS